MSSSELSGILASMYSTALDEGHSLIQDKILEDCRRLSSHVEPHKLQVHAFDEDFAAAHVSILMSRHPDALVRRLAATLHQERLMTQLRLAHDVTSEGEAIALARAMMAEMGKELPKEYTSWQDWPGTYALSQAAIVGLAKYIEHKEKS